jgi:hypothetical protein
MLARLERKAVDLILAIPDGDFAHAAFESFIELANHGLAGSDAGTIAQVDI